MKQFIAGLGIGLAAGAIYLGASSFAPPSKAVVFVNFGGQAPISGEFHYNKDGKDTVLPDRPLPGYADSSVLMARRYLSADGYLPTLSYGGREAAIRSIDGQLVLGGALDQARGLFLLGKDRSGELKEGLLEMKGLLEQKVGEYFRK